jgi:hypothetical protein
VTFTNWLCAYAANQLSRSDVLGQHVMFRPPRLLALRGRGVFHGPQLAPVKYERERGGIVHG